MSTYETLTLEREGSGETAVLTLNRPQALNAINSQMLRELSRALGSLGDPAQQPVRALILTGAGEKAFVAGADIAEMAPLGAWAGAAFSALGHSTFAQLEALPCVTIAAINGFALGGGLELAMSCDLLDAADTAKLGQPEVNLGVVPGFGGTQRLTRLVGKSRAKELIFTGDRIDAQKAREIGLVLEVLPKDKLLAHCKAVAAKIVSKGPLAVAASKRLIERGADLPLGAANELEAQAFGLVFDTDDRREGMKAFLEKRTAAFRGS
jgi:enoyl-CoA hydratase